MAKMLSNLHLFLMALLETETTSDSSNNNNIVEFCGKVYSVI